MSKNHIHVKRYSDPKPGGWDSTVEPADRSWLVFVHEDGHALFYRRVEITNDEGKTEHAFADVELPGSLPMQHLQPPELPSQTQLPYPGPIDFEVTAGKDPSTEKDGFFAQLNCRSIACWAETEHGAIQALLNYCVRLAVAGALDHSGEPIKHSSRRRYDYVFGSSRA